MKTDVTPKGAITYANGDGVYINGVPHEYAAYIDRWEDWHGEPHEGTGPAALTYEAYRNTGFMMQFFRSNQRDSLFTAFQMSHTWDVGSGVRPHMHVIPMASGSGDTIFTYAYAWAAYGDLFPPATGWVSGSVTSSWTPALQYNHVTLPLGSITPITSSDEAALLVLKLERSAGTDTYLTSKDHGTPSANVGLLKFDLAVQLNKAGTIYTFGSSSSPT